MLLDIYEFIIRTTKVHMNNNQVYLVLLCAALNLYVSVKLQ